MNKKVLFVSMLTIGMLVGCGNDKKPSKTIDYKEAITKINEHKEEISTYDRIGVLSTMENLKVEAKKITGTEEEKISFAINNAKEEFKVAGLVSATNASGFSASLSASVGAVTFDDGATEISSKDMAVKAYLNNSKLYVDLSNKALKSLIEKINKEPIPAEDPDKFYLPLTMEDSDFPLLSEDMFTKDDATNIEDLIDPSVIGGLIGDMDIDPAQITQMANTLMSSIDINDYVKVKSSKDYSDFSFSVELTKDNLVSGIEKAMKAVFTSMVPSESLTEEEKALIDAQVAVYVTMVKSSLEQGGFDHIKFNLEMRDYLVTELSYDVKAGAVIPSTPTIDDEGNPVVEENVTNIVSVEAKGSVKISYGDKVTVDTLDDYSEFVEPIVDLPGTSQPGSDAL